jgi:hypothetical protein
MAYGRTLMPAFVLSPFGKTIDSRVSCGISMFSLQCISVSSRSKTIVFSLVDLGSGLIGNTSLGFSMFLVHLSNCNEVDK